MQFFVYVSLLYCLLLSLRECDEFMQSDRRLTEIVDVVVRFIVVTIEVNLNLLRVVHVANNREAVLFDDDDFVVENVSDSQQLFVELGLLQTIDEELVVQIPHAFDVLFRPQIKRVRHVSLLHHADHQCLQLRLEFDAFHRRIVAQIDRRCLFWLFLLRLFVVVIIGIVVVVVNLGEYIECGERPMWLRRLYIFITRNAL
mmetsp:Transcript_1892/g.3075  ORF Transcript_1892/g.3075 Transcript_1892/m.3075 type:complete len:200 (-) Transcript_1892:112-711(-)